jgi:Mg-chelatase subunit ChlD
MTNALKHEKGMTVTTTELAERANARAQRVAQVAERYASVLSGHKVHARVIPRGKSPAWSTSNAITFVQEHLFGDLFSPAGAMSIKGLTLHETCHILFTPRAGSNLVEQVVEAGVHRAFNVLEDQRIETLMVGKFGAPVVPWLTAVIAHHLLNDASDVGTAFPLTHGRRYLSLEVRRAVRGAFAQPENTERIAAIIDEYRTLAFPEILGDERAFDLIVEFDDLIKQLPEVGAGTCADQRGDRHDPNADARPAGRREQERLTKDAQQTEKDADDLTDDEPDWGTDADSPRDADDADGDDGEADGDDGDADADADGDEGADDGGSDAPGNSAGDADGDEGAEGDTDGDGGGSLAGTKAGAEAAEKALQDALDGAYEAVKDEVSRDLRAFNGDAELAEGGTSHLAPYIGYTERAAEAMTVRASQAFGTELELLKAESDPGWERMTRSGRINAARYLRGADLDEAFDRWESDKEDSLDIEAVILLDHSGSMESDMAGANDSMWAIKRALDRINASTTVILFNEDAHILYSADETATSRVRAAKSSGGTVPGTALRHARHILANSGRTTKILLSITDGEWSATKGWWGSSNAVESAREATQPDNNDEVVSELREHGVLTAICHIGRAWGEPDAHNHEVVIQLTDTTKLFAVARGLVRAVAARNN